MARTNNLTNFLTDVADAIKEKKGEDTLIPASDFDTEILNLPSQGEYQTKSITITINGETIITPDQNYDAIEELTITTNVSGIDTSDATATSNDIISPKTAYVNGEKITGVVLNNGALSYTPSTSSQIIPAGYTSGGTISAVTSTIDENIIPENIKQNITILGVTGEYFGDMKLFDTIPHMQADTNPHDGGLATVYRTDIIPVTSDTVFNKLRFSSTVVLDEAFTDDVYCSFRSVDSSSYGDCSVELNGTTFRLDFWGDVGSKRVQYTSVDGITYTRTSSDEEIDFGISLKFENYGEPFPTTIGEFMKSIGNVFEGLYKYDSSHLSDEYISPPIGVNITSIDTTDNANIAYGEYSATLSNSISISRIIEISELVRSELGNSQYGYYLPLFYVDESGNYVYIQIGAPNSTEDNWTSGTGELNEIFVDSENNFIGCSYIDYGYLCKYAIVNPNTENITYGFASKIGYIYKNPGSTSTDGKTVNRFPTVPSMIPVQLERDYSTGSLKVGSLGTIYVGEDTNYYAYSCQMDTNPQLYANDPKYLLASTQLSNLSVNSLLPGIKAYGNNGIIEGDGTIWNSVPVRTMANNLGLELLIGTSTSDDFSYGLNNYKHGLMGRFAVNYGLPNGTLSYLKDVGADTTVLNNDQGVYVCDLSDCVINNGNYILKSTNDTVYWDGSNLRNISDDNIVLSFSRNYYNICIPDYDGHILYRTDTATNSNRDGEIYKMDLNDYANPTILSEHFPYNADQTNYRKRGMLYCHDKYIVSLYIYTSTSSTTSGTVTYLLDVFDVETEKVIRLGSVTKTLSDERQINNVSLADKYDVIYWNGDLYVNLHCGYGSIFSNLYKYSHGDTSGTLLGTGTTNINLYTYGGPAIFIKDNYLYSIQYGDAGDVQKYSFSPFQLVSTGKVSITINGQPNQLNMTNGRFNYLFDTTDYAYLSKSAARFIISSITVPDGNNPIIDLEPFPVPTGTSSDVVTLTDVNKKYYVKSITQRNNYVDMDVVGGVQGTIHAKIYKISTTDDYNIIAGRFEGDNVYHGAVFFNDK